MATITSIIFYSKVIVSYYNLITQFQELSLFFKGNKILDFYTVLEIFVFFPGNVRVWSVQVSIATSLFLQICSYKCLWDDSIKWEKCAWDNSTVLLWMYMRRLSKLEYYTKKPQKLNQQTNCIPKATVRNVLHWGWFWEKLKGWGSKMMPLAQTNENTTAKVKKENFGIWGVTKTFFLHPKK